MHARHTPEYMRTHSSKDTGTRISSWLLGICFVQAMALTSSRRLPKTRLGDNYLLSLCSYKDLLILAKVGRSLGDCSQQECISSSQKSGHSFLPMLGRNGGFSVSMILSTISAIYISENVTNLPPFSNRYCTPHIQNVIQPTGHVLFV